MEDVPTTVWTEARITSEGISVTLLSEGNSGAVVEDEMWFTFDELQEQTGSTVSMHLSE